LNKIDHEQLGHTEDIECYWDELLNDYGKTIGWLGTKKRSKTSREEKAQHN
jgi:hypothetical protein